MRIAYLPLVFAAIGTAQNNPPALAPGTVTIPVPEYNDMMERMERSTKAAAIAARPSSLQSIELRLQAEKGHATGTIEARGEVTKPGPVIVPLASGLNVRDARRNGAPVALTMQGGKHAMVLEGPVEFNVQLEVSMPLASEPGRTSLVIPPFAAGIVKLSLGLPGEEAAPQVSQGMIFSRQSAGGRTTIAVALPSGKPGMIWWSARTPSLSAPAKEARFLSDLKTLVSVTEAGLAMTVLADVTLLQGELTRFELEIPDGFELGSATGATLSASSSSGNRVLLDTSAERSHQFLITLACAHHGDKADLTLPGLAGAQRETGELLIEGQGALELAAKERGGLRRMDLREVNRQLHSLSGASLQSAFRYQKRAGEPAGVSMEWVRFPTAPIVPALVSRAVATTMVTREGRALTEIRMTIRNQSQAFARTVLPAGASILSAEVAGERVKPVEASDGSRIPLLRPGFRPSGPYAVSFVTMHAGTPFAKKGAAELRLPKIDIPAGAIEWEVFLPEELRASQFAGDVAPAELMGRASGETGGPVEMMPSNAPVGAGQAGGTIIDSSGAVIPNVAVSVKHENGLSFRAITTPSGTWVVPRMPSGRVTIRAEAQGFRTTVRTFDHVDGTPLAVTLRLDVGSVSESIEVTDAKSESRGNERLRRQVVNSSAPPQSASANVLDLQRRLSGVLPVAVTVPRTGNAHYFVRTLVVDEETRLSFQYRSAK